MRKFTVYLHEVELPEGIDGATSPNKGEEKSYTILLDSKQNDIERAATFLHEMLHIYRRDFESGKTVQQIEAETHAVLYQIAKEGGL